MRPVLLETTGKRQILPLVPTRGVGTRANGPVCSREAGLPLPSAYLT